MDYCGREGETRILRRPFPRLCNSLLIAEHVHAPIPYTSYVVPYLVLLSVKERHETGGDLLS